jgi:hypothetical protein
MSVVVAVCGSDEKDVVEQDGILPFIFDRLAGLDVLRGCDLHAN